MSSTAYATPIDDAAAARRPSDRRKSGGGVSERGPSDRGPSERGPSDPAAPALPHTALPHTALPARDLYQALSAANHADPRARRAMAGACLARELAAVASMPCDLPDDPQALAQWAAPRHAAVAAQYQEYLATRKAGAPRRYFSNMAHALYFLRCVGPTKLVDGAWLYGVLPRWSENDFRPLLKTYIEELGEGLPAKNHVVLYQRLLDNHGLNDWDGLGDGHFTQGALQLALGYADQDYLPEVVGFNLGYEQLPLHLLITAYELNELGIDPYYFTLHVTVDNAASGHAQDAIDAVQRLMARAADPAEFYRRVRAGYQLNDLGECTTSVIASFDLEAELVRIMASKAVTGQDMHGDYCRIAGKTINAWLADTSQIPDLLRAFESTGWIQRGAAPEESRFWRLIQGERAEMFGVFSSYEQQVLADWIRTPSTADQGGASGAQASGAASGAPRVASFRARQRALAAVATPPARPGGQRALIRHAYDSDDQSAAPGNDQLRHLEQAVALADSKADAMQLLIAAMSPARHHTAAGLMATRMFVRLLP